MMRNVPAVTTKILACSPRNLGRELDVRKTLLSLRKGKCFFLTSPLYRTPLFRLSAAQKVRGVTPAHTFTEKRTAPRTALNIPTMAQFDRSHSRELFSSLAHFLHFVDRQIAHAPRQFSVFFSVQRGERYFTCAVHPPVHHPVHPVSTTTNLQTKKLTASNWGFSTWRGRGVGWNDPS